jgi:hypothetical protein
MANFSLSTVARKFVQSGSREHFVGFKPKTLKSMMTQHGLYDIYLDANGLMAVKRVTTDGTKARKFDAVDMSHAIALIKSGELAKAEGLTH